MKYLALKPLWLVLILISVVFVIAQFFQPKKNIGEITKTHIFSATQLPSDIQAILETSCMDCHSNNTTYHWYHKLAPVSWLVSNDVNEGKKKLNFSDWGNFDDDEKISLLVEIGDEVTSGKMPIKPYLMMHPEAKISKGQKEKIELWVTKYSEEILAKAKQATDTIP